MISDDLKSIHAALGNLGGKISEEQWDVIRQARENLKACVEYVRTLETHFVPVSSAYPQAIGAQEAGHANA